MRVDRSEALRYLGCIGEPDAALSASLDRCERDLLEAAVPQSVHMLVPIRRIGSGVVKFADRSVHSHALSSHINGCSEGYLFAATLGVSVDRLIRRSALSDMSLTVVYQACAASLIESYCDEQEAILRAKAAARGLYLRPRFSPGYGDFPILHQEDFLALLDCPRKIGLTATESCMLTPSKSVTALMGLTNEPQSCHIGRCMTCTAKNCPFRKVELT